MPVVEIARKLSGLRFGEPQRCHGLAVFPLLETDAPPDDYLTLDEALERGVAVVTEVSETGAVPQMRFRNTGEERILLLDGEELVGAKQNRILNLSILVPAKSEIVVPVSCVESGRWAWRSRQSGSSNRAIYSKLRSRKTVRVSSSLAENGSRRADQGEIWDDIALKAQRMHAFCDTRASAALYERHRDELDEFVRALTPAPDQVGALFLVAGRAVGMDVFRSPQLFARLFPKLVRSYGLDALEAGDPGSGNDDTKFAGLIDRITAAKAGRYKAIGLGEDIRLDDEEVVGAALAENGNLVHLAAFCRKWAEA